MFAPRFGGPRRRRGHNRRGYGGGGGNFGLLLLGLQLFNFIQYLSSRDEFIPATLVLVAINILVFIRPDVRSLLGIKWPTIKDSCISVQQVCYQGQWERVILAPFVHGDSWHLYYNMASFMWKSRTLERHYGTYYYAYLTSVFTILTSLTYLAINFVIAEFFDSWVYIKTCAVGYSGVIFALKVVTTHLEPPGMTNVFGIPVPKRLAVWGELVLISVLFPKASFTGHLAGILVGVAFVSGPLKRIMDIPVGLLTGYGTTGVYLSAGEPSYNYTARSTGTRYTSTEGNNSSDNSDHDDDDDPEIQEAVRRSLDNEDNNAYSAPPTTTIDATHPYTPPPPYNPAFSTSFTGQQDSDEVRGTTGMSIEDMRNARLRKLTKHSASHRIT